MILGAICARSGSKGLPGKNTREMCGKPLMDWAIELAIASKLIDHVIVSTDINLEHCYPGINYVERPVSLSKDNTSKWEVWQHALQFMESRFDQPHCLVDLDVTRPLKTVEDVDGCIELFIRDSDADSVIAITKAKKNPYFDTLQYDLDGKLHPSKGSGTTIFCRADAPPAYDHGGIYVIGRDSLRVDKSMWDTCVHGYEIPRDHALDIDDETDWLMVERLMECRLTR